MTTKDFYRDLQVQQIAVHDVLKKQEAFKDVPANWNIIVTDVENSTAAVAAGNHQLVNLAATGSIVACLNISRAHGIEIPFFFGGDGATILVPDDIVEECLHVLVLHQQNCFTNFDFFLRVDSCKVSAMYDKGAILKMTKAQLNDLHIIPVVIGNALQMAENVVKSAHRKIGLSTTPYVLNLQGMECKWDNIQPPVRHNEILTLIIIAQDYKAQSKVYSEVLARIESIFGDVKKRHPIALEQLKMMNNLGQFKNEILMKFSKLKWIELIASIARSTMARWYLKKNHIGRNYLKELPQLTESLMIDGAINTVISGSLEQRKDLLAYLQSQQEQGVLRYGYFTSTTSVLSCYVTAMDDYHIHFLDGDKGGYTQAAQILKKQV